MDKVCIFCGENPVNKNKEHILPQWLIKMTGDPKRTAMIGRKDGKDIKFSWLNYVFPACEECNSIYSDLESKAKNVLEQIIDEKPISQPEMNLFLDWLDKIRIGVWLGQMMLYKREFWPNFYINQRIGNKDRMCLMYKIDDDQKGIGITGTESLIFGNSPSCFALVINNLVFFNYSKEFLLSENLGFPYPKSFSYVSDGILEIDRITHGKNQLTFPIIEGKIVKPTVKLYQSIINTKHNYKKPLPGIGSSFFRNNCYRFNNELIQSCIYCSDEQSDVHGFWSVNQKKRFIFKEKFERITIMNSVALMVFEHQNHSITEFLKHLQLIEGDEREYTVSFYENLIAMNKEMANKLREFLDPITEYI